MTSRPHAICSRYKTTWRILAGKIVARNQARNIINQSSQEGFPQIWKTYSWGVMVFLSNKIFCGDSLNHFYYACLERRVILTFSQASSLIIDWLLYIIRNINLLELPRELLGGFIGFGFVVFKPDTALAVNPSSTQHVHIYCPYVVYERPGKHK